MRAADFLKEVEIPLGSLRLLDEGKSKLDSPKRPRP
jgi:hypothetical protein